MITIKKMIRACVHFGHKKYLWNPKMLKFIFCKKNNIHIINLEKSLKLFLKAKKFVKKIINNKGTILFVCTKKQGKNIIAHEAIRSKSPFISQRWLGGLLTNFNILKLSIKKFKNMKNMKNQKLLFNNKKETLIFKKKLNKLKKNIEGIKNLKKLPDALFIIDVNYHKTAVKEANKLNIPIIGIVDTNSTPEGIKYVIPGNDDYYKAISLYSKEISNIIIKTRKNI